MAYRHRFGSYDIPVGITPFLMDVVNVVPHAKSLRGPGAAVQTGTLDARGLISRGMLIKSTIPTPGLSTIQGTMDALLSALVANAPASLWFGDDSRFLRNVQIERLPQNAETKWGRLLDIEIHWLATDPFFYSATNTTDTWSSPASAGTHALPTVNGTAKAQQPTFNITVGGAGAVTIAFTITHNTTGQAFTLAGSCNAGDVIVVDTLNRTVTISGVDKTSLFDGLWVQLLAGANTIRADYTGTAIASIQTVWADRYL